MSSRQLGLKAVSMVSLGERDSERRQILGRAGDAAHLQAGQQEWLTPLLERYYRHVALEDLRERTAVDLAGSALSHRQLAAHRPDGTSNVRAYTPTVEEHGWSTGHTVVEVVGEDMPFLVDSVSSELSRRGHAIHLVVHPQFVVRRDVTGGLVEILDAGPDALARGECPRDSVTESWIHVEIDRVEDGPAREDLIKGLRRVMDDVRVSVEDWAKMAARATGLADELEAAPPPGIPAEEVADARDLLRWLRDEHFTFLGYRDYRLVDGPDGQALVAEPATGLGILRYDQKRGTSLARMTPQARAKVTEPRLLVLTTANSRATVHRPGYLDYVGVKRFNDKGEVVGERRFLGLFTSEAYTEPVTGTPVVRGKVQAVLERAGFSPASYASKHILQILETYPREELFQIGVDELFNIVLAVLHLQERRRTRLFLRPDEYGRFVSCLVYLPRDRYTTAVRERMESILLEAFGGTTIDYTARVSESVLARLHFVVRLSPGTALPQVDASALEARLVEATRAWDEDLADAVRADVGEETASHLLQRWGGGFPESYKENFSARVAVADLRRLEDVDDEAAEALGMNLYEPVGAREHERRFKLYRWAPLSLSAVLPYLTNLGVEVVDERPYELRSSRGRTGWIYDFGLRWRRPGAAGRDGRPPGWDDEPGRGSVRDLFCDAFRAAWSGQAESDRFDRLVLLAGLTWRQVTVLRAYAKYLRQAGTTFSQDYIQACLCAHVELTRLVVRTFETRFDPGAFDGEDAGRAGEGRKQAVDALVAEAREALDEVKSLDHDRILRSFVNLVLATVRTNAFAVPAKPYLSLKLDPAAVPELPAPRPAHEIFVYSPRVEGVHLRFGAVARGGLRWSDRREDFRTEILGLVKAQMVKNAVIVPTGAKGGFVGKQLPDAAAHRDDWFAEGLACYTTFIRGLLDVTDNYVPDPAAPGERLVVPPQRVVRHDDDDPYLVVAADKGTATFSDVANGVANQYGFWLGDAFASGGSAGYDHKAMGITARGAWESVKRHFRELDRDVQREDFTVVGVGDMSGDVFGNGMLLSEHIRLVAAFDHRHIFLDPDPDAFASFAQRQRMFGLQRSSWEDYDAAVISPGGGIYPRSAKSIAVTPQVAGRLGIAAGESLTPAELIRAILRAPVDLLWNGGIGTYVKASGESHADVGDKANDAVRVDGRDLRARVVGEGGNLGLTQLGRIEAALNGVRVNTDAIDNSAGVDCSDHEVNIKILMDGVVADGDLTTKQRNALLERMTDDVSGLVLRDNYEQNVLLGNERAQSLTMVGVHERFMRSLEGRGRLDRGLEFLPDRATLERRAGESKGLTSPEFSVLAAYAKISLADAVLASGLPDEPWLERVLHTYFPPELRARYADRMAAHPLRREIIANALVNEMVNHGGITFAFRAEEETAATADQVARCYVVCREVFDLPSYVTQVEALDGLVSTEAQTRLYRRVRRLLDRSVRWFLQNRPGSLDMGEEVERFRPTVTDLAGQLPELLVGVEHKAFQDEVDSLGRLGVPPDFATRAAGLLIAFTLLDIGEVAATTGTPTREVGNVYFLLSERYGVEAMLGRISRLGRLDRWQSLARAALRYDLYAALEALTVAVLTGTGPGDAQARVRSWEAANAASVARATQTLEEVRRLEKGDLASLSVALRTLRSVVRSSA